MEGKEVRFGITDSAMFDTISTATSCGCVNSFIDSYTPLGGLVPLTNIALGEIVFGGVGSGLYGMLMFAIIAVFIAGLMVGRTPEYLGKKIERKEIMMAALALLILPASILGFTAVASVLTTGCLLDRQCRAAWTDRDALCLYLGQRQQWLGDGRSGWQPLLELDDGHRHVDWPLRLSHPAAGLWGFAGAEKSRTSRPGNLSHQWSALCRFAGRGDPDRGCADLLPGLRAGADCGTPVYAGRKDILR